MDPAVVAAFYQGKGYAVKEGVRMAGLSGNEHRVPLLAQGPLGSLAIFFGDFGGVDGPEMGGARKVARDLGATPVLAADSFSNQDRQVAARLGVVLLDGSLIAADDEPPASAAPAWPGGLPARPAPRQEEPEPHPWPASGRVGGRDGPATRAIDVDELLADTRRAPAPAAEPEPLPESVPATVETASAAEGLWKHPRSASAQGDKSTGRRPGGNGKFAWLAAGGAPPPAKPQPSGAFAIDYDDVVPSRAGATAAADSDEGPPRLGDDEPAIQDALAAEGRRQRLNRLQRRIFWLLFAFVFIYLFYLFWN